MNSNPQLNLAYKIEDKAHDYRNRYGHDEHVQEAMRIAGLLRNNELDASREAYKNCGMGTWAIINQAFGPA